MWRLATTAALTILPTLLLAADWPTYRGDNARSGSTTEAVEMPLGLRWVYESPAPPRMAWSSAEGRLIEGKLIGHRVKFDDAMHPVVVGDTVYLGSSVDHQLHAMNLNGGQEKWSFFTGGAIRLAPTVAYGLVYFGSDDGYVYCLNADNGQLVWKLRVAVADEWLLARGTMISRWPVRTGVMVHDGVVYFGAGIFPHEDIYLMAVRAKDGKVIWRQDNLSAQNAGRDSLTPQGYLLAQGDRFFMPSGRMLPAAFDCKTGQLIHHRTHSWRSTAGGVVGGTRALLADDQIFASGPHHMLAMTQSKGDVGYAWIDGRQMSVAGDDAFVLTGTRLASLNRKTYAASSQTMHKNEMAEYSLRRKHRVPDSKLPADVKAKLDAMKAETKRVSNIGVAWTQATTDDAALLATGKHVFVGGEGSVTAYDRSSGESVWQSKVDGVARSLVLSNGHFLVSTTSGHLHVFATGDVGKIALHKTADKAANPFAADEWTPRYETAAKQILESTGVKSGFCMVAGSEDGRLAYHLAKNSNLQIYAIESDAAKVASSRAAIAKSGLYGSRITVLQGDPSNAPFSNYFANLIVSDTVVRHGKANIDWSKVARHIKPLGGVLCLGQPAEVPGGAASRKVTEGHLAAAGLGDEAVASANGSWGLLTRGQLPGAGSWSHQYANPSNTAIGDDKRIKGGLGVLWYGDPGPGDMVNRHDGAVGPLSVNGRLFVQGDDTIKAYDAYNGQFLWQFDNPEALRTGVFQNQNPGNLAASHDRLFHFVKDQCVEVDAATGKSLAIHRLPKAKDDGNHEWGYLAVHEGLLIGTATVREEVNRSLRRRGRKTLDATDGVFAIDLKTRKHLWHHQGSSISHHTIAMGPGKVFFIDSSITSEERAAILREDKTELANLTGEARKLAEDRAKKADVRRTVALDAKTGEQLWSHGVDVTDCSDVGIGGGKLTLMYQNGVLMLGGANANGHYWRQFVAGEFKRRRLVALSATDGYKLWSKDANYRHRPIIIGEKVLAEPWFFDLQTGEQLTRKHPLTGQETPWSIMRTGHHCGMLTGCDSGMLLFRSGDTGFFDLNADEGVRHFAGHRMGCWINAIVANGLVLIPEASAGCVCQFSIESTIVMEPRTPRRPWTIYSAVGAQTPVQHMSVNIGAPGDRKDAKGNVWLSFPRYKAYQTTSLDVGIDLKPSFATGGGYRSVDDRSTPITDTDMPWLYSSWGEGVQKITLPLLGPDDQPTKYDIKLHFANHADRASSFAVIANDEPAIDKVELPAAADGVAAITKTLKSILVKGELVIELKTLSGTPSISAIEAIRID